MIRRTEAGSIQRQRVCLQRRLPRRFTAAHHTPLHALPYTACTRYRALPRYGRHAPAHTCTHALRAPATHLRLRRTLPPRALLPARATAHHTTHRMLHTRTPRMPAAHTRHGWMSYYCIRRRTPPSGLAISPNQAHTGLLWLPPRRSFYAIPILSRLLPPWRTPLRGWWRLSWSDDRRRQQ